MSTIRRLLREGLVTRSLLWPPVLAAGTLLATLLVVIMVRATAEVAVPADLDSSVHAALVADGFTLITASDPASEVGSGHSWAATDGQTIWLSGTEIGSHRLEGLIRQGRGSSWRPDDENSRPDATQAAANGVVFVTLLSLLFSLYGVVFGLGLVARDRDDGTLEAELALPVGRWVPGAARWLAGTLTLTAFLGYSVLLFKALIGVPSAWTLMRHGFAACAGSISMGMLVIGTHGTKAGFSGSLAAALAGVAATFGVGAAAPYIGAYFPIASVLAGGSGWWPTAAGVLLFGASSWIFAIRSARV